MLIQLEETCDEAIVTIDNNLYNKRYIHFTITNVNDETDSIQAMIPLQSLRHALDVFALVQVVTED